MWSSWGHGLMLPRSSVPPSAFAVGSCDTSWFLLGFFGSFGHDFFDLTADNSKSLWNIWKRPAWQYPYDQRAAIRKRITTQPRPNLKNPYNANLAVFTTTKKFVTICVRGLVEFFPCDGRMPRL